MNDSTRLKLLRSMLRIRMFEEKVLELIEEGKLESGFHLLMGHEAVTAGVSEAMRPTDYVTSNHRTMGRYICRGGDMKLMMAEVMGKATGLCKGKAGEMLIADTKSRLIFSSVTVGAGIPVAVGAAIAAKKYLDTDDIAVAYFGDGASCNATFHEALNMAAVHRAPVLFICENNGLSINIPQREWMPTETVAERSRAYCIPGVSVDGTDVEAVHRVAQVAITRARRGLGPSLIDAQVVRLRPHKEGLRDTRSSKELKTLWRRDPVGRYLKALRASGLLTRSGESRMRDEIQDEVNEAVEFATSSAYPDDLELYRDLYGSEGRAFAR